MYISSDSPLLQGQRQDAARRGAESDARIACTKRMMACGRVRMFETIMSPDEAAEIFGMPTALDVAILQNQSLDSRAALLATTDTPTNIPGNPDGMTSLADIYANAPDVVSLNAQADQTGCSNIVFQQRALPPDPTPGMPQRAPVITPTDLGPLYFKGAAPTYKSGWEWQLTGLSGLAPPWGDAWVESTGDGSPLSWIQQHPWLAILLAGGGVLAVSEYQKRSRRKRK